MLPQCVYADRRFWIENIQGHLSAWIHWAARRLVASLGALCFQECRQRSTTILICKCICVANQFIIMPTSQGTLWNCKLHVDSHGSAICFQTPIQKCIFQYRRSTAMKLLSALSVCVCVCACVTAEDRLVPSLRTQSCQDSVAALQCAFCSRVSIAMEKLLGNLEIMMFLFFVIHPCSVHALSSS